MPFAPRLARLLLLLAPSVATAQSIRLPGLHAPVEIVRDSSGIAHITARDEHDLFFAQGWNAARDRLGQLELWRRQATGTMAEALGPRWAARDRAARLFAYRGDMARELASYHPRGAAIVQAFVDGVNARVDQVTRDPSLMPPELRRLGITPGRWTPAVVVSRHNALAQNAERELDNARAVGVMGAAAVRAVSRFEPEPVVVTPDSAVDIAALSDSVLAPYRAWRAPMAFVDGDLATGAAAQPGSPDDVRDGSNNWVIDGTHTASGRPILANDPHRTIQVPSLRYWVHLQAPGWNVVGGGEPALPGISVGHNEHGAWGLTIFAIDVEDIYVYHTDPADPTRYRYGRTWERMTTRRDTVRVHGAAPQPVTLRYTRHGPVLWEDTTRHLAYALRAAWREPGTAPYLASLRIDQARTWKEFRAAAEQHLMPAENLIWADTSGVIGWQAAGIAPRRTNWSGLVPVPGDGRYEWSGFLPIRELPNSVRPATGYVATANENNVPAGYAHNDAVAHGGWGDRWRVDRVREVLDTTRRATAASMAALQQDERALAAVALVPLLDALPTTLSTPQTAWARDSLRAWNRTLSSASVTASVYVAWERALSRRAWDRVIPAAARRYLPTVPLSRVVEWLTRPATAPATLFTSVAGRDSLLAGALTEALGTLTTQLGPDPARWRYGQVANHFVLIRHPLSTALDSAGRSLWDVGPLPRGGYANTVNATGGLGNNQTHGASFRLVADVADWDGSLGTNTPGQSGDPRSPHYRDLFDGWAAGRYFRVPFTAPAVKAAAESHERLVP